MITLTYSNQKQKCSNKFSSEEEFLDYAKLICHNHWMNGMDVTVPVGFELLLDAFRICIKRKYVSPIDVQFVTSDNQIINFDSDGRQTLNIEPFKTTTDFYKELL